MDSNAKVFAYLNQRREESEIQLMCLETGAIPGTEEQGHWEVKEMEGRGLQEVREMDEEVLAVRER